MSIWNDSPRLNSPPQTKEVGEVLEYVKGLANTVAKMAKDLEFILNGNVAFDNIRAEGIEAKNIKAGAVTAEKITVNELSAITANLGHILAGLIESVEIYGSYIATRKDAYPRAEMSATDNMFAAMSNVNNHIRISAVGGNNSPQLLLKSSFANLLLLMLGTTANIMVTGGDLMLGADNMEFNADEIRLFPNNYKGIRVSAFSDIVDNSSGKSLQEILNSKADK